MKSSCITHPAKEPMIVLREWQIDFCGGDRCAGLLLSFFEYWHNIKLEMRKNNIKSNDIAEMHADKRTQDEALFQFHNQQELEHGIMGLYKRDTIKKALAVLVDKKVISIHKNPNPRYYFDKTNYFLFAPEVINKWINSRCAEDRSTSKEKPLPSPKNPSRQPKNQSAITETSSEISSEDISVSNAHEDQKPESQNTEQERSKAICEMIAIRKKKYPQVSNCMLPLSGSEWVLWIHRLNKNEKIANGLYKSAIPLRDIVETFKYFMDIDDNQRTNCHHPDNFLRNFDRYNKAWQDEIPNWQCWDVDGKKKREMEKERA